MNKSKLEILLEEAKSLSALYDYTKLASAYNEYMEERKTIPQPGQEIEVTNFMEWGSTPKIEKFIGFKSDGTVITESECGEVDYWDYYRIPTPKKKWNVVKNSDGIRFVQLAERSTDLPIITTFED
jgi:hypothetical protein